MCRAKLSGLLAGLSLLSSAAVFAEGRGEDRGPRQPPQAAFDACASSSPDAVCAVQTPNGDSLSGHCLTPPRQEQLVCVPDHHRQRGKGPRDEAREDAREPRS